MSISWTVSVCVSATIAFCVYYNSLQAGFVYDDSRVILSNEDILPSTPIENIFKNDFWGTSIKSPSSHGSYRPLCILTYRLNYWWSGLKPYTYHLVNVLLHCICTALVHHLGSLILPSNIAVIVSSLLFAVHPIHTEAVAGVVGRADILSCIFYILTILTYIYACRKSIFYIPIILVLTLCSTLSKEIGVTAVPICMVFDVIYKLRKDTSRIKIKSFGKSTVVLGLSFIMIMCLRLIIMGESPSFAKADNPTAKHPSFVTRSLTFLYLPILNLKLLVFPNDLSYDWGMDAVQQINDIYDLRNLLTILFYATFSGICLHLLRHFVRRYNVQFSNKNLVSKVTKAKYCDTSLEIVCNYCKIRRKELPNILEKMSYTVIVDKYVSTPTLRSCENDNVQKSYEGLRASLTREVEATSYYYVKKTFMILLHMYMNGWDSKYKFTLNKAQGLTRNVTYHVKQDYEDRGNICEQPISNGELKNRSTEAAIKNEKCEKMKKSPNQAKHSKCTCKKEEKIKLKHKEILSICIALLVIPFIPASNLFFYVGFVIAERVLYIPSVGYCYLVAYGYHLLLQRIKNKKVLHAAFLFLLMVYSMKTVQRNEVWMSEESLYRSGITINEPKSYGNLGSILSSQRRYEEAEKAYRMALDRRPNMADVHYNLGILLQNQDRSDEAISSYQKAIFYRPALALAYLNLGQLLASKGKFEMAEAIFRKCSQLDGTGLKDPKTHEVAKVTSLLHLGKLYSDRKQFEKAVAVFREALNTMPTYYQPSMLYSMLGEALAHLNRHEDAENMYKAALKAQPSHIASHLTYGKLLSKNRTRLVEAEVWFRKAQKLAPDDPNVYQHYGQFLLELGRYREAVPLYKKAVELSPSEYDSNLGAATALRHNNRLTEAEKYYRRAAEIKPLDAGSHSNLGAILHLNRKYKEAAASYAESIRLEPNDNTARSNLKKLQALISGSVS